MSTEYIRVIDAINDCYKKMLEIGKCADVFRPVGGRRPDILTAKSKVEFQKTKKHNLEVQLISYYRCTKTFNIHWCWYCTRPKKILKLQTAYAYRKGNTCQRTDSWARMDNQQPQYWQMQCLFGMSHPEEYFNRQWELNLQQMPYTERPRLLHEI